MYKERVNSCVFVFKQTSKLRYFHSRKSWSQGKPDDFVQCPKVGKIKYYLYNGYLEFIQGTVCSTIRILKGLRDYNDHAHDDPLRILEFWRVWKQLRWNGLVLEDPCAHHLLLRRPTVSWPPPFYWAPDFQTKFFTKNQIIH